MSKYLYPSSGNPDKNLAKEFTVRQYYHRSKGDRPARHFVNKGNHREVLYIVDGSFYLHKNPRSARATVMYEPSEEVHQLSPNVPIAKQCAHEVRVFDDTDEIGIQTSMRAKMCATILALQIAFKNRFSGYGDKVYKSVVIACDLEYIVRGITEWVWGWRERGWVRPNGQDVKNVDMWKMILFSLDKLERHGIRVRFWLVDRIKGPK